MRTSIVGINLIKEFESLHDGDLSKIGIQPKMDPIGIWTEGYGKAMRGDDGCFLKGKKDKDKAYAKGRAIIEKLKDTIPRHLFQIILQAAIGGQVIARETTAKHASGAPIRCFGVTPVALLMREATEETRS